MSRVTTGTPSTPPIPGLGSVPALPRGAQTRAGGRERAERVATGGEPELGYGLARPESLDQPRTARADPRRASFHSHARTVVRKEAPAHLTHSRGREVVVRREGRSRVSVTLVSNVRPAVLRAGEASRAAAALLVTGSWTGSRAGRRDPSGASSCRVWPVSISIGSRPKTCFADQIMPSVVKTSSWLA